MNKVQRIIIIISLSISMILSCSFSVFAETTRNINLIMSVSKYWAIINYDKDAYNTSIGNQSYLVDIDSIIYDHNTDIQASSGSVDDSYPSFIAITTTDTNVPSLIGRTTKCMNLENLSQFTVSSNAGANEIENIIEALLDIQLPSSSIYGLGVEWGLLYDLGYRIEKKASHYYNNTQYYIYKFNKFKDFDNVSSSGTVTTNGANLGVSWNESAVAMHLMRVDFNTNRIGYRDENNNYVYMKMDPDNQFIQTDFTLLWTDLRTNNSYIYETNDISIYQISSTTSDGYTTYTYRLSITGPNPYIIFAANFTYNNDISQNMTNDFYSQNLQGTLYTYDQADLTVDVDMTDTNLLLTEIKDLLSDFEVQEINNIYQNVINDYDVDIDLEIQNLIGDLETDFNELDFEDPNVNIDENDLEKVSSFKIIFSNMMNTMNQSGIGVLYFLPLVLIIIGAIL